MSWLRMAVLLVVDLKKESGGTIENNILA